MASHLVMRPSRPVCRPAAEKERERTETNPIPFLSIVTGPGDDGRQQHDQLLETRSDGQRSRRRIDLLGRQSAFGRRQRQRGFILRRGNSSQTHRPL